MNWPSAVPEPAAALTGAAALSVAVASFLMVRRRRRLHRRLIEESVAAMAAQLANGPTPLVRAQRGLATTLADQQRLAARVDGEIRPYVLGGPAKPGTGKPPGARPVDRIAAALHELRSAAQQRGGADPVPGGRRSATGPVPGLDDSPELLETYDAMLVTATDRIRQANMVLLMAVSLDVVDQDTRARLADSLRDADAVRQDSEALAEQGRLVSAVQTLADIGTPVPDNGVPGEATRRDMQRHSAQLREIAVTHEAELLGWLTDARTRCAPAKGATAV